VWVSKLQSEIAFSTTEAKYIALSTATREILSMLRLIKEAVRRRIISKVSTPLIHCKLFEDNKGTMEMANILKMAPRTKYLNIKYHFFRQNVQKGILQVLHIKEADQAPDIFTKALDLISFQKHHYKIMEW
jgi:hypothetical protein